MALKKWGWQAGCLVLLAIYTLAAQAELRDWSSYTSDNFVIYSDATERVVRDIAEELETFRKIVLSLVGLPDYPEGQQLKIMLYSRNSDFREIGPESGSVIGFYNQTNSGPLIAISPRGGGDLSRIFYHEYVHHLIRSRTAMNFPRWYHEGFAEVLTYTIIRNTNVTVGSAADMRLGTLEGLEALPLRELLAPSGGRDWANYEAKFYATAWLFTHYLQLTPWMTQSSPLHEQTEDYLARYNNGEDPIAAFEASYEMTPEQMDGLLSTYRRGGRFPTLRMEIAPYAGDFTRRDLSASERAYAVADVAWRVGREQEAINHLRELEESGNDDARALSLHAILENHLDNHEVARSLRQRALELGSSDTEVLTNIGHFDLDSYTRSVEDEAPNISHWDNALNHSLRATELDPNNLEAYYFQYLTYQAKEQPIEAINSLVSAYNLYPTSFSINLQLGRLLKDQNEPEIARTLLQRVYNWTHNERQRADIQILLDEIDGVETPLTDNEATSTEE